jgi:hypothetical protein
MQRNYQVVVRQTLALVGTQANWSTELSGVGFSILQVSVVRHMKQAARHADLAIQHGRQMDDVRRGESCDHRL